jgi:DNA-binding MarR family transcriptional regulator
MKDASVIDPPSNPAAPAPQPALSTEEAIRSSASLATWWHLARSFQAIGSRIGRFLEEEGITGAQFGVLRCLGDSGPGGMMLTALSERLLVSCGNTTGVVDRLEYRGYLRRERSAEDRRVIMARLTPQGEALHRALVPRYRAFVNELLAPVPEEDQRLLAELCERLNRTLQRLPAADSATAGIREEAIR